MNKYCGIYKITSPTNKIYIGQSIDIERRWKPYKYVGVGAKKQVLLYRSLLKHGSENHIFEIIEECEVEELNSREGYWQDFYDSVNNGLNCRRVQIGDKSGYDSPETKDKRRQALLGKKHTQESIDKMKVPRPHKRGSNHPSAKAVENYVTGQLYETITEACLKENYNNATLYGYLHGKNANPTNLRFVDEKLRPKGCGIYINNRAKIIIDNNTGVFYYSLEEASKYSMYCKATLYRMLSGKYPNKTSLDYTN
jgi:group I intron endonuclease